MSSPSIATLLREHVSLSISSIDRLYLNGYVPLLQAPGHITTFCRQQLNAPIASPALFRPLLERFTHAVDAFAELHDVPIIHFSRGQKKDAIAAQQHARFADEDGVVFIGIAREGHQLQRPQANKAAGSEFHLLAPAGVRQSVLLLFAGSRVGSSLHQDRQLSAVPGSVVPQRARVGQAAGAPSGTRLRKPRQRLPLVCRSRSPAAHLRSADPERRAAVLRSLAASTAVAADQGRSRRRLRSSPHHLATGGQPHPGLPRAVVRSAVL